MGAMVPVLKFYWERERQDTNRREPKVRGNKEKARRGSGANSAGVGAASDLSRKVL